MKKAMENVGIFTEGGKVWIEQITGDPDPELQRMSLYPEQVPLFLKWMQDAISELQQEEDVRLYSGFDLNESNSSRVPMSPRIEVRTHMAHSD
jgi:hypothetical protein